MNIPFFSTIEEYFPLFEKNHVLPVSNITDSSQSLLALYAAKKTGLNVLFLADDKHDISAIAEELITWNNFFKTNISIDPLPGHDTKMRPIFFRDITQKQLKRVVIMNISDVTEQTVNPAKLPDVFIKIFRGSSYKRQTLIDIFSDFGFTREDEVSEKGTLSIRGAIIDLWQLTMDEPIRMVFDGDILEHIHIFDPVSQRSKKNIDHFELSSLAAKETTPIYKYFSHDEYIVCYPVLPNNDIKNHFKKHAAICIEAFLQPGIVDMGIRQSMHFRGMWDIFFNEFSNWEKEHYDILIIAHREAELKKIREIITNRTKYKVTYIVGDVREGFISDTHRSVVLTEYELFEREYSYKTKTKKSSYDVDVFSDTALDYKKGDYIVHTKYGLGQFLGFQRMTAGGKSQDYITIAYQGNDKLYVPMHDFSLISLYVREEGYSPKLDKLGGIAWQRTKEKIKQKIWEMAEEIVSLQASRKIIEGTAFNPDKLETNFAETFPYEETPDQKKAIEDVLKDMTQTQPMERLVCGDVGFGKTEVAIRAAMRAVVNSKQIALLVPTTVLAEQHFNTFKSRFQEYPVRIAMLSRFQTSTEKQKIIEEIEHGSIDIVISTHSIVRRKVQFASLGIVIIDEEHRFGVKDKEKIKQLCKHVDLLMLSATPIPRTLSMALSGLKNISLIESPPPHRKSIKTHIGQFDKHLVRSALNFEIQRKGQVFYVFNRIEYIGRKYAEITEMTPKARIGIAHGQMSPHALEKVMTDFFEKRLDILLSTTIVESGLDIPSVNLMVIDGVQSLGLAELYQLRGRIGRGWEKAFCYMFYPPGITLTETAVRRLQAIQEFAGIGSGFKLALRDLEIRGAGNMLGKQQHGYIREIGLDLYSSMLEEAVQTIQTGSMQKQINPKIDIALDAYIPDTYVKNPAARMHLYKMLLAVEKKQDLRAIEKECIDRFGPLAKQVSHLFTIAELRYNAKKNCIISIKQHDRGFDILFDENENLNASRILAAGKRCYASIRFHPDQNNTITVSFSNVSAMGHTPIKNLKNLLQALD